jgi:hypothetical protein
MSFVCSSFFGRSISKRLFNWEVATCIAQPVENADTSVSESITDSAPNCTKPINSWSKFYTYLIKIIFLIMQNMREEFVFIKWKYDLLQFGFISLLNLKVFFFIDSNNSSVLIWLTFSLLFTQQLRNFRIKGNDYRSKL